MTISEMEISTRAFNCLKNAGVETIDDARRLGRKGLLMLPNFGPKTLAEFEEAIGERLMPASIDLTGVPTASLLDELQRRLKDFSFHRRSE
jgi:DNA-directed RNA polymerase subunit alpha